MESNEEDDISVITINDSDGSESLKRIPNFNIRLLPSMSNVDSDIKQAHTALSTAYGSIKTKLSKVEQENRELKIMLSRKKSSDHQSPQVSTGNSGGSAKTIGQDRANGDLGRPGNFSDILRHKRSGLAEESQHKRHGSWAHYSDQPHDQGSYVQFIELQTENIEREKQRLQEELEQLKVRYTDNQLQISKLKQDGEKQDESIQKFKAALQAKHEECQRYQRDNEELKKMNAHLKVQLKNYDQVCSTNKLLEERLQHHVDVQTRRKIDNSESGRQSLTHRSPPVTPDALQSRDTESVTSLHQALSYIQEQNLQLNVLKKVALQQRAALSELMQQITDSHQLKEPGQNTSTDEAMQHPITCEDDLEKMLADTTSSPHKSEETKNKMADYPPSRQDHHNNDPSDDTNLCPGGRHGRHRFPSQNSEGYVNNHQNPRQPEPRQSSPPLVEVPWAPVKRVSPVGGVMVDNPHNNSHNPFLVADIPGEIRSDGVFDEMEAEIGGITTNSNYCDSNEFTVHNSEESQTQVKLRLPSTNLENYHVRTSESYLPMPHPPPTSTSNTTSNNISSAVTSQTVVSHWPTHDNNYTNQGSQVNVMSKISYPPTMTTSTSGGGVSPVSSVNRQPQTKRQSQTEVIIRPRTGNNIKQAEEIIHPQSEVIRRVTGPPTDHHHPRPRHGSMEGSITTLVENPHYVRCPQGQGQEQYSQETNSPRMNNLSSRQRNQRNPFLADYQGAIDTSTSSPSPLNNIEQNILHDSSSNNLHSPQHSNITTTTTNNSNKTNTKMPRDVNINTEQPLLDSKHHPGCSNVRPPPLNNDPLYGSTTELGIPNPVPHINLNNSYLTVKLPPVENAETSNVPQASDRPKTQTCPVCTQLFPTTSSDLQEEFERHVNECLPESSIVPQRKESAEAEERQCIMCERKFHRDDQTAYENHVQSHFHEDQTETNYEILDF